VAHACVVLGEQVPGEVAAQVAPHRSARTGIVSCSRSRHHIEYSLLPRGDRVHGMGSSDRASRASNSLLNAWHGLREGMGLCQWRKLMVWACRC
jgi:hypothetical protein